MYRRIMVPLDGSGFGEHALPLALTIARQSGARLDIVHVHLTDTHRPVDATVDLERRGRERAYLDGITEQIKTVWDGLVESSLLDGVTADAIEAYVASNEIDLAVLTTHGRGALSRFWLGSVADQLVHRLSIPMILVRPHETGSADLNNPPLISHVLVPLDGSEMSEQIIPHALVLGRLLGARYSLVQALEHVMPEVGLTTYAPIVQDIEIWIKEVQEYLEQKAAQLRSETLEVKTEVLIGSAAITILDYARDHAVDLIALETHGRTGTARLLLGSVADKIVRGSGTAVLLHRPQL